MKILHNLRFITCKLFLYLKKNHGSTIYIGKVYILLSTELNEFSRNQSSQHMEREQNFISFRKPLVIFNQTSLPTTKDNPLFRHLMWKINNLIYILLCVIFYSTLSLWDPSILLHVVVSHSFSLLLRISTVWEYTTIYHFTIDGSSGNFQF